MLVSCLKVEDPRPYSHSNNDDLYYILYLINKQKGSTPVSTIYNERLRQINQIKSKGGSNRQSPQLGRYRFQPRTPVLQFAP